MTNQPKQYRLPCPNCKAVLVAADVEHGLDITCPRCQTEFASESVPADKIVEVTKPPEQPKEPLSAPTPEPEPASPSPKDRSLHRVAVPSVTPISSTKKTEQPAEADNRPLKPARPEENARKPKPAAMPTDTSPAADPGEKSSQNRTRNILLSTLVLLSVAGVIALLMRNGNNTEPESDSQAALADSVPTNPASDADDSSSPTPTESPEPAPAKDVPRYPTLDELPPEEFSLQTFLQAGRPQVPERENWERAAALAKAALESPSWQHLLSHVRAPDHVKPLMREYYAENPYKPKIVDTITGIQLSENEDGRQFAFVVAQLEDYDLVRMSLEMIDDEFKLDWESFVSLQEMSWSDFRFGKPDEPVEFRVGIMEEQALGVAQITQSAYHSFRLVRPGEASLPAYLPINHEAAAELFSLVQDGNSHDVILKLRYSPDPSGGKFVEIVELVQKGWIRDYPDDTNSITPGSD